jgi:glutamate racemase
VDTRPLGIFDSGVGGLTVVRAVQDLLPDESIIYLGDTARVPYGSKSPETIRRFAAEDVRFLTERGVKAVVVACNTATAHALPQLREEFELPVLGVIEPGVEAALADPQAERIGVIATRGTIRSHAYQHALAQRRPGVLILDHATPLLVPLIEEDWIEHPATETILHTYLDPLTDRGVDTLLLACTHYPLLMDKLRKLLGPEVRLVDSATTCAEHLRRVLNESGMLARPASAAAHLEIHLTDLSEQFEILARRFLRTPPPRIRRAELQG